MKNGSNHVDEEEAIGGDRLALMTWHSTVEVQPLMRWTASRLQWRWTGHHIQPPPSQEQYVCMDHITADRFDNDEKRENKESQQNINLKMVTAKRFEPTPFSDQRLNLAP
jgi:hypothetical protein